MTPAGGFESQLRRAIVESERLRVIIAGSVLTLLLLAFLTFTGLQPGILQTLFNGHIRRDYVALGA